MSTITQSEIKRLGELESANMEKSASMILNEIAKSQKREKSYDVFFSHSFKDAITILGLKRKIESFGYSVYIDWIEDPKLDRTQVNINTAELLRKRMNNCKSLFYATTRNSTKSKWMPWECGYFDGYKKKSAIFPITVFKQDAYKGQEYLGLYPYVTEGKIKLTQKNILWVRQSKSVYCSFDQWLNGKEPYQH